MLKHTLTLTLLGFCCSSFAAERESFDFDWKFAKFGKHADCLSRQEPGALTGIGEASSEEAHNPANKAFDNNKNTRWCASGSHPASLMIDFGEEKKITSSKITWEKKAYYPCEVEVSPDGTNWLKIYDNHDNTTANQVYSFDINQSFRYARVKAKPAGGAWVSIFEWEFFDSIGNKVTPKTPEGARATPQDIHFDDSAWRTLDLPHDWGVESPFIRSEPNQTGSLPWNAVGWYRKEFTIAADKAGKQFYLDFDGVMMTPQVYVNGKLAGEWKYGYNSFRIDITPFLKFGEKNLIAVRAENLPNSTRWYPGAGIYRHTWLVEKNPIHIDHWGIFVHTSHVRDIFTKNNKFYAKEATLSIETKLRNPSSEKDVKIEHMLFFKGKKVPATIIADKHNKLNLQISIKTPELWDINNPALYTLKTTVSAKGKVIDSEETSIGIRQIAWKPNGFYLNGRRVQIKGVCQHHDLGPLGGAVHKRAIERQVEILKSFGVNSIRTSHNPPAPELLEVCDKMGILVDAELFDCWKHLKEGKANGYNLFWNDWREKDVRNFVLRDRNHPSVIIWSAGNEIAEQGSADGKAIANELVSLFKKYDPTRLVTVGCNDLGASWNGFGKEFDVYGFNYKPNDYKNFAKKNPQFPFIASETSSCISTRGFYSFPQDNNFQPFWRRNFCDNLAICQVSDYGIYAPGWAYAPDVEFGALEDEPNCAGEYVWTGFDYLGEPTPWNLGRKPANDFRGASPEEIAKLEKELAEIKKQGTPARSSYFGIVDLCGFWKDRTYLYQSHWMPEKPMAHILPHWNWVGRREGKITPVFVYTSGDSAELFLNGKSLGKRTKKKGASLTGKDLNGDMRERFRLTWMDVVYQPGTLEVVTYKDGKEWARDKVETTGNATQFKAIADRSTIIGDGRDLSYITISTYDAKKRFVPTANNLFRFKVTGPIEIVGVCNGDQTDARSMKGNEMPAFNGLTQVIVRSKRGETGTGILTIESDTIGTKKLKIKVSPTN